MSQENVETVRAAYEAWNAQNMDSLRELYDPGVMVVTGIEGWPEQPPDQRWAAALASGSANVRHGTSTRWNRSAISLPVVIA